MRKVFLIILIALTLMTSCTSLVKSYANDNSTIEVKSDGQFAFYRKGELWYKINVEDKILEFPVPISDTGDATFLSSDKATLFLRYIRKHLEHIEEGKNTNEKDK